MADGGPHDDCIMALAIAYYIRSQQSTAPAPADRVKWTESQWEDYNNADYEIRKYLIQKWGEPER